MTILARLSVGRILLHLIAMLGDRSVRFHFEGIARELPWIASGLAMLTRAPSRPLAALTLYLAQPIKHSITDSSADLQSLAAVLKRGDVLLTHGNSRFAALIKCVTRSPWSHVSMYVGPLDDGPDPLCVVEADIAVGVRSIRLSELNALHVRVLRPVGLTDRDRCRLADWVVGRIGSEYDLAHAWGLLRNELRLWLPDRFGAAPRKIACSATGFICCSLLAPFNANVHSMSPCASPPIDKPPAATVTYWTPSSMYVMGGASTPAPVCHCHNRSPVRAS